MFDSPYDRAFGVEIECGFPGGTREARNLVDGIFGDSAHRWSIGADGTEVEIRTPILEGEEGFATLKRVMQSIREAGGYVTPADGMHVHHDAPEFRQNPTLAVPLVESWRRNTASIQAMVAPRRRNSYGACPEWSDRAFQRLTEWASGRSSQLYIGRNDLNLAPLTATRPHIEIRLHEGTLDDDVAVAWIQFGQKFLFDVVRLNGRRLRKRETEESLLDRIKLSPEATAILLSKKQYGGDFATPLSSFREGRYAYDEADYGYSDDYYDEDEEDRCGCDVCQGLDE